MAKVQLDANSEGMFEWPKTCIGCGAEDVVYDKRTFQASSPLQLLSIGPWFFFGAAFKTEPTLILVALALTVIIYSAATHRIIVAIPRCSACITKRKRLNMFAGLSFTSGLLLLVGSLFYIAVPGTHYTAILGVSLLAAAWIAVGVSNFYYGLRLLSANSQVAKFRAPTEVQTVETRL